MIEKCPHCKTDVIFSRDICPACGHPSKDGEREEATYLGEAKTDGRPVYNQEMEVTMTARQRHGRILTGIMCGAIPAPLLAHTLVYMVWFRVSGWVLLSLFVSSVVVYHLWYGRKWAHWLAVAGTLLAGCAGPIRVVLRGTAHLNAVDVMAYVVFALVYLWCAWQLALSTDIREFLDYQRKHTPDY
jgi:hypothetical protein